MSGDVEHLDLDDLIAAAEVAVDGNPEVRDWGLLESALARPRASVFGADAYPDRNGKAAALLHSIVTNHALMDGNKCLGLVAVLLFYGMNGCDVRATEDERVELVIAIADGRLSEVEVIAEHLARWVVAD
ncbi:type II toxin-antitoxin system death-on-curing family toxin [Ornithinimicrobium sp. F0845]|uniref:type II toxin-antitoxin system death-on-curing family toxin n=1 Tax=Ornithinimicrobium sp. F0845 TaxID=2926412 RepID=UPI001FF56BB1|nr:type II toxin-antitoxin system death-on-curing family toxin [Ornithinimicrobium sp. F0845]